MLETQNQGLPQLGDKGEGSAVNAVACLGCDGYVRPGTVIPSITSECFS